MDTFKFNLADAWREEVYRALAQGLEYTHLGSVHGDIAEFGVGSGGSAHVLAAAIAFCRERWARAARMEGMAPRRLFLFDSFEGYPATVDATEKMSPRIKSGFWGQGQNVGRPVDEIRRMCTESLPEEQLCIFEGYFETTLPMVEAATKFALVHLDCNLYESTRTALFYLLENSHLTDGTALFFDDWNCGRANPKFGQRRAWAEAKERFSLSYSDCGEYAGNCRKFILHMETGEHESSAI